VSELGGARFRAALWTILGATLVVVSLIALRARSAGPPPPVLLTLPEFTLTNRDGRTVRSADLRGEPWIASFVFTRCRGACPMIVERMRALGESTPTLPRLVSFSVDPEFDTPAVLADWARERGIDDPRWLLLTGERAAVYSLVRDGFKLAVGPQAEANSDEPILHSSRLVLVDGQGRVRGTYDAFDDERQAALRRDAARVAER
jgi:protein SCO1/2